jgi:hypothetical protein
MGESIFIENDGQSTMNLSFFQYSNFTLDNAQGGDTVKFATTTAVDQHNNINHETLAETIISPQPNRREDGIVPSFLTEMATPNYILNQANNSSTPDPGYSGDVYWAYEWDTTLSPGDSFIINKDKRIQGARVVVPEPSALTLVVAGFIALCGLRARRRRLP